MGSDLPLVFGLRILNLASAAQITWLFKPQHLELTEGPCPHPYNLIPAKGHGVGRVSNTRGYLPHTQLTGTTDSHPHILTRSDKEPPGLRRRCLVWGGRLQPDHRQPLL